MLLHLGIYILYILTVLIANNIELWRRHSKLFSTLLYYISQIWYFVTWFYLFTFCRRRKLENRKFTLSFRLSDVRIAKLYKILRQQSYVVYRYMENRLGQKALCAYRKSKTLSWEFLLGISRWSLITKFTTGIPGNFMEVNFPRIFV